MSRVLNINIRLPAAFRDARTKDADGARIVRNALLGGWFVVRGPQQTPLSGKFNSKEEAEAWLRTKGSGTKDAKWSVIARSEGKSAIMLMGMGKERETSAYFNAGSESEAIAQAKKKFPLYSNFHAVKVGDSATKDGWNRVKTITSGATNTVYQVLEGTGTNGGEWGVSERGTLKHKAKSRQLAEEWAQMS